MVNTFSELPDEEGKKPYAEAYYRDVERVEDEIRSAKAATMAEKMAYKFFARITARSSLKTTRMQREASSQNTCTPSGMD